MAEPVKQIANSGPNMVEILGQLDKMIGGQKTSQTTTSSTSPDAKSLQENDLVLQKIFADMDPANIDAMVGNIIERARQAFGPTLIGSNAAGVRAYSDTVLESLKNEAVARSVGEASAAKLKAIQEGNQTAAQVTANRMNATKQNTTSQSGRTGASDLGKATGLLTLGSYGLDAYKKLKKITPNSPMDVNDLASGGEGVVSDANAYSSEGGGITSVEAGSGGTGAVASSAAGGGASTVLPPPSVFSGGAPAAGQITAADVLTPDTSTIQEILASQGISPGTAMPAANAIDPATTEMAADISLADQGVGTGGSGVGGAITAADVITPDTSSISEILSSQGLTEGSAMPAAQQIAEPSPGAAGPEATQGLTDLSALDTSATAGLPTAEELSVLTGQSDLGLAGMGELSELGTGAAVSTGEATAAGGGTAVVGEGAAAGGGEAAAAGAAGAGELGLGATVGLAAGALFLGDQLGQFILGDETQNDPAVWQPTANGGMVNRLSGQQMSMDDYNNMLMQSHISDLQDQGVTLEGLNQARISADNGLTPFADWQDYFGQMAELSQNVDWTQLGVGA